MDTQVRTFGFKKGLPLEFEVKDLADVKRSPHLFTGPLRAEFYQIIWLTAGEATFDLDFRKVKITAGELMIISVNQVYGFDVTSDYEGKMILFTESFFIQTDVDTRLLHNSDILNPSCLNRTVKLHTPYVKTIMELLDIELRKQADGFQSQISLNYLRILLLEMERGIKRGKSSFFYMFESDIARSFCDEVEKQFKQNRQSEYYAQQLGVNEKTLSREVQRLTNKTPKRYIDSRVILEAKRLLTYTASSIKEICFELGFDETTNFDKFFRKHTGLNPTSFRQTLQR